MNREAKTLRAQFQTKRGRHERRPIYIRALFALK